MGFAWFILARSNKCWDSAWTHTGQHFTLRPKFFPTYNITLKSVYLLPSLSTTTVLYSVLKCFFNRANNFNPSIFVIVSLKAGVKSRLDCVVLTLIASSLLLSVTRIPRRNSLTAEPESTQHKIGHCPQLIHTHPIFQSYFHNIYNIITSVCNPCSPKMLSWRKQRQCFFFSLVSWPSAPTFLCIPCFPRPSYVSHSDLLYLFMIIV